MSIKLEKVLKDFMEGQKELKGYDEEKRINDLSELFEPIAKYLLCGGCFVVYSGRKIIRRIFPYTVEFYYH